MLKLLQAKVEKDSDLPDRAWTLEWRELFRTSAIYDKLPHAFCHEKDNQDAYIPLRDRRPSVIFGLPTIIVNDTTSLLFGDGHFPTVDVKVKQNGKLKPVDDPVTDEIEANLADIIEDTNLKEVMLDAAVRGSVGSVALAFALKKSRVFWDVMSTRFLTPEYDAEEPDKLSRVIEKYKVLGKALRAQGYAIDDKDLNTKFWFQRIWTREREEWYLPWPVQTLASAQDNIARTVRYAAANTLDTERTVDHKLGFVPIVWIKNLPGGDKVDGICTFEAALSNSIEIDYQLSQGGRGLKYSSDPTLVIKEGGYETGDEPVLRSASNALRGGEGFDAKLLEISGSAASAVLEYVRALRELSLELCGGNRASPEKLSGAQSGRAMELMNQSLIWLADKLRTSYGTKGLIPALKMVIAANEKFDIVVAGETLRKGSLGSADKARLNLKWPPWYAPTAADHAHKSTALKTYRDAGAIDQETAVKAVMHDFDIADPDTVIANINREADEKLRREADANAAAAAAKPTLQKAA